MTPEQIALVGDIVAAVGRHPEFGACFYRRLFSVAPQTEAMFGDVAAQQRKLVDELTTMVELLGDLSQLDERARALGARHRGYGVRAAHYRVAREVFLDSLDEVLGDEFGPAEREAWDRATSLITELMQSA